jgi:hypothetical protein
MNLFSLLIYGAINGIMVLLYLRNKGRYYQFPFWAGMIAIGWFLPQSVGEYFNASGFPHYAYFYAMLFASLCTLALWFGFSLSIKRKLRASSWLAMEFNDRKLFYAGAVLCVFGFYFYLKLWNLPEEELSRGMWTGAATKYLFLASVFKFGFLVLWLRYLIRGRWLDLKTLVFIIPCLSFLLWAAFMRGRRSEMMNLVSYCAVSFWFCRNKAVPRGVIITGLLVGLVLVNSISIYRSIIMNKRLPLGERIRMVTHVNYISGARDNQKESNLEFNNYVFQRQAYAEDMCYDYGIYHWNRLVFNYVPAQIVGADLKESLMFPLQDMHELVEVKYGYYWNPGSTETGYADSFGSFGWLGAVKFFLIGWMMGVLYNYAISGSFLGKLLYVYSLTIAMVSVTHGTNEILVRIWIYFFILGFPVIYWAQNRFLVRKVSD